VPCLRKGGDPVPAKWLLWLLGLGLLAAVIVGALHMSEHEAVARAAARADPIRLVLALLLQVATYPAQGEIWRRVGDAAGWRMSPRQAFELSVAKVFADQALPSGGVSSSVLVAKALHERRTPEAVVNAVVLINFTSYHLAYALALLPALIVVARRGETNPIVVLMAALFFLFSIGVSAAAMALAGRHRLRLRVPVGQMLLDRALRFVAASDPRLMRGVPLLAQTIALQLVIVLLDAATMWLLVGALGPDAPPAGVFASFMIASLFRTMGVVPGGLGTFEATSVWTLRMAGVPIRAGLGATLLFRGLSFWMPMLPGYWFSRRVLTARRH